MILVQGNCILPTTMCVGFHYPPWLGPEDKLGCVRHTSRVRHRCLRAIIDAKVFLGLQMLTWVWLARAQRELTKPKSTFSPKQTFSGLHVPSKQRASHCLLENSFLGQMSPWTKVSLDNCLIGIMAIGQLSPWTPV